jgi:hypothetical protein
MVETYIQAIQRIQHHRDMVKSFADDMTKTADVRAHFEGQVSAYDLAIREIHETFKPDVDFDPMLYQDPQARPVQAHEDELCKAK